MSFLTSVKNSLPSMSVSSTNVQECVSSLWSKSFAVIKLSGIAYGVAGLVSGIAFNLIFSDKGINHLPRNEQKESQKVEFIKNGNFSSTTTTENIKTYSPLFYLNKINELFLTTSFAAGFFSNLSNTLYKNSRLNKGLNLLFCAFLLVNTLSASSTISYLAYSSLSDSNSSFFDKLSEIKNAQKTIEDNESSKISLEKGKANLIEKIKGYQEESNREDLFTQLTNLNKSIEENEKTLNNNINQINRTYPGLYVKIQPFVNTMFANMRKPSARALGFAVIGSVLLITPKIWKTIFITQAIAGVLFAYGMNLMEGKTFFKKNAQKGENWEPYLFLTTGLMIGIVENSSRFLLKNHRIMEIVTLIIYNLLIGNVICSKVNPSKEVIMGEQLTTDSTRAIGLGIMGVVAQIMIYSFSSNKS